jgi:hypothetical protein
MSNSRGDGAVVITGGSVNLSFAIADTAFHKTGQETYTLDGHYITQFALTESGEETEYWVCEPGLTFVFNYAGGGALTIKSDATNGVVIEWTPGTFVEDGPNKFIWQGRLSGVVDINGSPTLKEIKFDPKSYQFSLRPGTQPVSGTQRLAAQPARST